MYTDNLYATPEKEQFHYTLPFAVIKWDFFKRDFISRGKQVKISIEMNYNPVFVHSYKVIYLSFSMNMLIGWSLIIIGSFMNKEENK